MVLGEEAFAVLVDFMQFYSYCQRTRVLQLCSKVSYLRSNHTVPINILSHRLSIIELSTWHTM
jgi:hypothetical protein